MVFSARFPPGAHGLCSDLADRLGFAGSGLYAVELPESIVDGGLGLRVHRARTVLCSCTLPTDGFFGLVAERLSADSHFGMPVHRLWGMAIGHRFELSLGGLDGRSDWVETV